MNINTSLARVSLTLGALDLPVEALLGMREGDTIEIDQSTDLSGALELDGKAWAFVSVSLTDGGLIRLKVSNLA